MRRLTTAYTAATGDVRRADCLLAAAAVAWGVAEDLTLRGTAPLVLQVATGVVAALALVFRRTAPVAATSLVVGMLYVRGIAGALTFEAITPLALLPLMFYSIARNSASPVRAVVGGVALGGLIMFPVWDVLPQRQPNQYGHAFLLLLLAAGWAAGWVVRRRWLEAIRLRRDRDVMALTRERFVRDAAVEEQLRIAAELNAHVRGAIQLGSAHVAMAKGELSGAPELVHEHLSASAQAARNALGDLRRLLTLLRSDDRASLSEASLVIPSRASSRAERMIQLTLFGPPAAVALVSVVEVFAVTAPAPTSSRLLGAVAVSIPLFWRRRYPLTVAISVAVIVCARAAFDHYGELGISAIAATSIAAASAARLASLRHAAVAVAASAVGVAGAAAFQGGTPNDLVMLVILVLLSAFAALAVRRRSDEVIRSKRDFALASEARERSLRIALSDVRRRIARDTHDGVGHALASMNMHAEAAMLLVETDQSAVLGHIESVEHAAREAVTEMDELLSGFDALQLDDQDAAFGLDDLEALASNSGLDAQLTIDCQPLPSSAATTAYRIVKEALVNAAKHAPGAAVIVEVRDESGVLHIAVANQPSTRPAVGLPGGHGMAGLQERVALLEGRFTSGPQPGGGWTVEAELPLNLTAQSATQSSRAA